MGRAARNNGGTGGHGCVPLPGERPNYNRHVMTDKALHSLVSNNDMKKLLGTKEKQPYLGQQKGSAAQPPNNSGLNLSLSSAKLPLTSAQQPVTTAKQKVTSAKQPVSSAKQHLPSVKQSVSSAKQPVSSAKQPVSSARASKRQDPGI